MSLEVGKTYIFDNPCQKDCSIVINLYIYTDIGFIWCLQIYSLKIIRAKSALSLKKTIKAMKI